MYINFTTLRNRESNINVATFKMFFTFVFFGKFTTTFKNKAMSTLVILNVYKSNSNLVVNEFNFISVFIKIILYYKSYVKLSFQVERTYFHNLRYGIARYRVFYKICVYLTCDQ